MIRTFFLFFFFFFLVQDKQPNGINTTCFGPNLNIDEGLCWVGSPTQSLMSARMDEAESRLRTSQI